MNKNLMTVILGFSFIIGMTIRLDDANAHDVMYHCQGICTYDDTPPRHALFKTEARDGDRAFALLKSNCDNIDGVLSPVDASPGGDQTYQDYCRFIWH